MRRYVLIFLVCCAIVIGVVAGLNYLVDPYLIHAWDSAQVQRLRSTQEKLSAWSKTYAVARFKPEVLYLGNSRTELGLPADWPAFEGRTVFNAALSGASLADMILMARHAANVRPLDTVVWGLDAPSFAMVAGNTDFVPELVADGPFYPLRRSLLTFQRVLTLEMVGDSLRQLSGQQARICRSSLALNGQRDGACMAYRIHGWGGTQAAVAPRTREYLHGAGPTEEGMQALATSLSALCADATRVRLYINPTHAMTQDTLYWAGKWPAVERWMAALAALAEGERARGCDLKVYDFAGYNNVTSEAIPQVSGRSDMVNYWEPSHYRDRVGRMILARMFGGGTAPEDFGVELTPAVLPAYLKQLRVARERYHRVHPLETAWAQAIAISNQ
jgi:hypothetical protein